ncbi:MAG: saccharopine dehydrogenase NADP-binding domain-containing protein [Bacteroidetes bacterium]|nr:saccharopine dehydrogenase NADP-binding domain-containing protein [Bacteroidota bacterium]MBL7104132.1 saccharopine dehydrogenase NADP-binding domain-containing protein [Bacteroidales bacterium]
MNIIVLGCGLVGGPMAIDLVRDEEFNVTVADKNKESLEIIEQKSAVSIIQIDLSDPANVTSLVKKYDFVVSAVPGFMGFQTLRAIIEAGKDVVDIAFFPEDMFVLDDFAKQKGVIAISDIGVAPGMSNLLVGYADHLLDQTEKAVIYVGGLPKVRELPFEYKAVFSPVDVIEEYTRLARYIENGKEVVKPALSDPELLNFEGLGTLEAFNSDGLRSLAKTIDAPNMIEKTLRYPGHIEIMRILRDTGFFSKDKIEISGVKISPLEFTSKLLFPKWKLEESEEDITIMKIMVEGLKEGKRMRYTYNLFDRYDPVTKIHSMARTTGYTATMALRMITKGLYKRKGVSAPEFIGKQPECAEFILKGLEERGVVYKEMVEVIDA